MHSTVINFIMLCRLERAINRVTVARLHITQHMFTFCKQLLFFNLLSHGDVFVYAGYGNSLRGRLLVIICYWHALELKDCQYILSK